MDKRQNGKTSMQNLSSCDKMREELKETIVSTLGKLPEEEQKGVLSKYAERHGYIIK